MLRKIIMFLFGSIFFLGSIIGVAWLFSPGFLDWAKGLPIYWQEYWVLFMIIGGLALFFGLGIAYETTNDKKIAERTLSSE